MANTDGPLWQAVQRELSSAPTDDAPLMMVRWEE